jgi:hypothetical protein
MLRRLFNELQQSANSGRSLIAEIGKLNVSCSLDCRRSREAGELPTLGHF